VTKFFCCQRRKNRGQKPEKDQYLNQATVRNAEQVEILLRHINDILRAAISEMWSHDSVGDRQTYTLQCENKQIFRISISEHVRIFQN